MNPERSRSELYMIPIRHKTCIVRKAEAAIKAMYHCCKKPKSAKWILGYQIKNIYENLSNHSTII